VYINTNLNEFTTISEIHSHNRRRKDYLFILPCNTSLCKNNFNNIGIHMLNQLPLSIKELPVLYKFKRTLKSFLLYHCFYTIVSLVWGISQFKPHVNIYIKHRIERVYVQKCNRTCRKIIGLTVQYKSEVQR
jgi:hypothetical protein